VRLAALSSKIVGVYDVTVRSEQPRLASHSRLTQTQGTGSTARYPCQKLSLGARIHTICIYLGTYLLLNICNSMGTKTEEIFCDPAPAFGICLGCVTSTATRSEAGAAMRYVRAMMHIGSIYIYKKFCRIARQTHV
jgi:hypothetical protein